MVSRHVCETSQAVKITSSAERAFAQQFLGSDGGDRIGREGYRVVGLTLATRCRGVWRLRVKMSRATDFVGTADLPQTVCPSLKRRLTLDITARVTRIGRAEPQTRRASRGPA